jgi:formylglycine-generating enzyme required for sulfatase activity/Tol biopolymer transport system component
MSKESIRYLLLLACFQLVGCTAQESTPQATPKDEPTPQKAAPQATTRVEPAAETFEAPEIILDVYGDEVTSVAFSPDGELLATGSWDPDIDSIDEVRLWDVSTGEHVGSLSGHGEQVLSVAFSPDGQRLAAGLVNTLKNIVLWDLTSGEIEFTLEGHGSWVRTVAFSPDGNLLASGGDLSVILWDVSTGELLATLEGHTDTVNSVMFSPDGETLASGSDDGSIMIWDVSDFELMTTLEDDAGSVLSVAYSPDGSLLAAGVLYDTVHLWDLVSGELLWTRNRGSFSKSVSFSPDGSMIASGLDDGSVLVWNVQGDASPSIMFRHENYVDSVAFSPDGQLLASGSGDGTVALVRVPAPAPGVVSQQASPSPEATPLSTEISPVSLDAFGVPMVRIPAGVYEIGGQPEQSLENCLAYRDDCVMDWFTDETPIHLVDLDAFMIDQYEVTNAQYEACVEAGFCSPPAESSSATRSLYYGNPDFADHPVIHISWENARSYCSWRGGRLPTEAEWEAAARGDQGPYPWGSHEPVCDEGSEYGAKFDDEDVCNDTDTEAVGSYPPNDNLLYDMAGNVMEWTADWYDAYPSGDPSSSSEYGEIYRVARGGSWYTFGYALRTNIRFPAKPRASFDDYGFRCASAPFEPVADQPSPTDTQTAPSGQEELKDEWRTAIHNSFILSTGCVWMFETHTNFQQGEIDLEEAKSDLAHESDYIAFTHWDIPEAYQNDIAAELMWRLEEEMRMLIELIDTTEDDMIGSPEVLDILTPMCGTFMDLEADIAFAAMDAGLTEESISEIDPSSSELYDDFNNLIFGDN